MYNSNSPSTRHDQNEHIHPPLSLSSPKKTFSFPNDRETSTPLVPCSAFAIIQAVPYSAVKRAAPSQQWAIDSTMLPRGTSSLPKKNRPRARCCDFLSMVVKPRSKTVVLACREYASNKNGIMVMLGGVGSYLAYSWQCVTPLTLRGFTRNLRRGACSFNGI